MVRVVFIIALLCLGVFSQEDNRLADIECNLVKTWVGSGTSLSGWWKQNPCPPCSERPGVTCDSEGHITSLNITGKDILSKLPVDLQQLTRLQVLDLSHNLLTGSLPESWASCLSLTALYLQGNRLEGSLPDAWGELLNLKVMNLADNAYLGGTLPAAWLPLKHIETLVLSGTQLTGDWKYNGMEDIKQLDLNNTGISTPSLDAWWAFLCRLDNSYTVTLPDGSSISDASNPQCPSSRRQRLTIVLALSCSFVVMLAMVLVVRRRRPADAATSGCLTACLSKGARAWLTRVLELWPLLAVFVNVGTDVLVLIEVAPKNDKAALWPFYVLLGGLWLPELLVMILACYTYISYSLRRTHPLLRVLLLPLFLVFFPFWAVASLLLHTLQSLFHILCCCCTARTDNAPCHCCRCCTTLTKVIDAEKFGRLVSLLMLVSEDPISASVTSIFFLVNKRRVGQSLTTRTYCLSMLTSCGHILMEVWNFDWSNWQAALKDAFDLRFNEVQRSVRRGTTPRLEAVQQTSQQNGLRV